MDLYSKLELAQLKAKNHIFEYIEIYYNRKRFHSKLGYETPDLYEVKKSLSGGRFLRQDQSEIMLLFDYSFIDTINKNQYNFKGIFL